MKEGASLEVRGKLCRTVTVTRDDKARALGAIPWISEASRQQDDNESADEHSRGFADFSIKGERDVAVRRVAGVEPRGSDDYPRRQDREQHDERYFEQRHEMGTERKPAE